MADALVNWMFYVYAVARLKFAFTTLSVAGRMAKNRLPSDLLINPL